MAKKWVQYDGKKWVVVGSEGGGGTGHTHPNLSLLNSITQAMVTSWNTAATWIATNGASVLSHIADTVKHITSEERATWDSKLSDAPSDGSQYARQNGEWTRVQGGGGGGYYGLRYIGAYSVKSGTVAEFNVDATITGLNCIVTYSSNTYTALIPVNMLTSSYVSWGISASNTYIEIRLKKVGNTVSMTRSSTSAYTITVYGV